MIETTSHKCFLCNLTSPHINDYYITLKKMYHGEQNYEKIIPENNAILNFWKKEKLCWFNCRAELLKKSIFESLKVNGLYLEFGVYTGGTINLISSLIPNKIIYGFDWFKGLPDNYTPSFPKGSAKVDFIPYDKINSNVKLIVGLVQDTLIPFLNKYNEKIAFMHLDLDVYSATSYVLNNSINFIQKGTIIQFDEFFELDKEEDKLYWYQDEFDAWNEFIKKNNVNFNYIGTQGSCCSMIIT
jgi:hypothetical protein